METSLYKIAVFDRPRSLTAGQHLNERTQIVLDEKLFEDAFLKICELKRICVNRASEYVLRTMT